MAEAEKPNEGELILYQTQEGAVRIEVLYQAETFWLNQKRIAELFGVELPTISYHLKEIYDSGELSREATLRKFEEFNERATVRSAGKSSSTTWTPSFRWATGLTVPRPPVSGFGRPRHFGNSSSRVSCSTTSG